MADSADDDLQRFQADLANVLRLHDIACNSLKVSIDDHDVVQVSVELLQGRLSHGGPVQQTQSNTSLCASAFIESPDTGRQVIWGQATFSVDREHSCFFPVPQEYGEYVSITFGWEFDAETLEPGYADVRERNSIHYVSVLPSGEMCRFISGFAEVLNRWLSGPEEQ